MNPEELQVGDLLEIHSEGGHIIWHGFFLKIGHRTLICAPWRPLGDKYWEQCRGGWSMESDRSFRNISQEARDRKLTPKEAVYYAGIIASR